MLRCFIINSTDIEVVDKIYMLVLFGLGFDRRRALGIGLGLDELSYGPFMC